MLALLAHNVGLNFWAIDGHVHSSNWDWELGFWFRTLLIILYLAMHNIRRDGENWNVMHDDLKLLFSCPITTFPFLSHGLHFYDKNFWELTFHFNEYTKISIATCSLLLLVIIYTKPICLELFKFISVAPQVSSLIWHRVLLYSY
jgi:hypothetical protein